MVRRAGGRPTAHRKQRGSLALGVASLAAGVVVATVASGAVVVLHRDGEPRPADSPSRAVPAIGSPATPPQVEGSGDRAEEHWLAVLAALDARRAAAWRSGRADLLADAYTEDSAALRVDRGNLHDYLRRGLRVTGVHIEYRSVTVERRRPDSVVLLVVDRLAPAFAITRNGHREPLPRDRATRHRLGLSLVGDRWRIATVSLAKEVPDAARTADSRVR